MKDEKKIFLFLACCLLIVALTGCSRDDKTTTNTGTSASVTNEATSPSSANEQTNGSEATPTTQPGGINATVDSTGELGSLANDAKETIEDIGTDLGITKDSSTAQ